MTDTSWYPGEYRPDPAYPPHYRTMPDFLRYEDVAELELRGKRRDFWIRCRDSALREWAPLGLELRPARKSQPFGPDRVTFSLMNKADYGLEASAAHCFEVCKPIVPGTQGADWVQVDREAFEQQYQSRTTGHLKYWLAHEFGHSLGFGHGGDGIMDQTPDHAVVNTEEIYAAKSYWGLYTDGV